MDIKGLSKLRCPQNWGLDRFSSIEEDLINKFESISKEESESFDSVVYTSKIKVYSIKLLLSFEYYNKGILEEALELINEAFGMHDEFMDKYRKVFDHCTLASRAHVLYKLNYVDQTNKLVTKLIDDSFNDAEEACFLYLQASFLHYYTDSDQETVLQFLENAVERVPDEAEFHYTLGRLLAVYRHREFPVQKPSQKEFHACRQAVLLKNDIPNYSITLARLYMDSRHSLSYSKKNELKSLAASVYTDLLKHSAVLCGNDIARCVFNLCKVQFNSSLKEYAELALKKSDSILTNHYIGTFYLQNKQFEEAYKCFNKAVFKLPFISCLVVYLKYKLSDDLLRDEEIDMKITELTEHYKENVVSSLYQLYLDFSQFYLLAKGDLDKSIDYFLLAAQSEIKQLTLIKITKQMNHYSFLQILQHQLESDEDNEKSAEAIRVLNALPKNVVYNSIFSQQSLPELDTLRRNLL